MQTLLLLFYYSVTMFNEYTLVALYARLLVHSGFCLRDVLFLSCIFLLGLVGYYLVLLVPACYVAI